MRAGVVVVVADRVGAPCRALRRKVPSPSRRSWWETTIATMTATTIATMTAVVVVVVEA
jgi:hypothetical protein